MNIGDKAQNTRDGRLGIVIRKFKNGSVAVLEKICPVVINTHDSEKTLKVIEENSVPIFDETKYKVSPKFDMDITFDELIAYNKTCKIDVNSSHHFETYGGILIYVSHPKGKEKFSIQIGVDEDGFMYEGDYGCQDSFKEIPIEEGLSILNYYRKLINSRQALECALITNNVSKDFVEINIK